jgi:YVTN family beta-propeller protein
MAIQPDGSVLYVPNALSNDISVIDTATNTVFDTFGYFPAADRGMVIHPDGSIIYVLDGDEIAVISAATHGVNERIPLDVSAIELAIHPDGHKLYATAHTYDLVLVIDTASNSSDETIPVGGEPLGINVNPDGKCLYVVCQDEGEVYVFDSRTYTLIDKIPVGSAPIAFGRFIGPLPEQVGGTVTGVSVEKIVCRNRTTRQRVVIDVEDDYTDTWNCEAEGLDVQPGDIVIQTVSGVAQ